MPTEREWGTLEREVHELRHDFRNFRMVVTAVSEDLIQLRQDHQSLKTKIATSVAAIVLAMGIVAWALEMFIRRG